MSPKGAPVPNATVTIIDTVTNNSRNELTGPDGGFSFAGLPPGLYRVDVDAAGFAHASVTDIHLNATTGSKISVTLVSATNAAVQITAHAPTVQSEHGVVSFDLGAPVIWELPLINRNTQFYVRLFTGINPLLPALDNVRNPEGSFFFSTNGQSPDVNVWERDGAWDTEPFRNTQIRVMPQFAVSEMYMETANQLPEKGFNGGAWVNQLSREGANTWHGDLFEFWSGDDLRSRSYFSSSVPHFVYNQFGADVGAPIVRDSTWFFASYQGTYANGATNQLTTVPVPAAVTGDFSSVPGLTLFQPNSGSPLGFGRIPFNNNMIPSPSINQDSAAIASFIPAPNLSGFVNNYVANVPLQNQNNRLDGRIDHHFTDKTSAFVRYGYTNSWNFMGSPLGNVIGASERGRLIAQSALGNIDRIISDRLVTELRFGYNRFDQHLNSAANQFLLASPVVNPLAPQIANPTSLTGSNLVGMNIAGFPAIGAPAFFPEHAVDNTFNGVWMWSLQLNRHEVRWGVDIRRIRTDGFTENPFGSIYGPNGTAYFGPGATLLNTGTPATLSQFSEFYNSFAAFLTGTPSQFGISNYLTTPTIRQTQYSGWISDHWKPLAHLNVDVGVRYEVYSPLESRTVGASTTFNPINNTLSYPGLNGLSSQVTDYNFDNVAPRIGFAWEVAHKTVVRGGYGIQYFQAPLMFSGFMGSQFGYSSGALGTYSLANLAAPFAATAVNPVPPPTPLTNGSPAFNLPYTVLGKLDTPYIQTYSLQVQRDFYYDTLLSVGYVGNVGRHLLGISELNSSAPGTDILGLPFIGVGRTASTQFFDNSLTDNYNSLQVSLSKRFGHGLSFLGSYTFQKAMGFTTSDYRLLDPVNLSNDYGRLDFDRQHLLTISHVLIMPWQFQSNHILGTLLGGWELTGIFTWATGTPLTVTADPLTCTCVGNTVVASLNPGATAVNWQGTSYLNPNAFSAPVGSTFGNLARGAITGPGFRNYDMALFKNFRIMDRFNLQLRGEAFNITNTAHFTNPVTNINSPAFGQTITPVSGGFGRQLNVAARIMF